MLKAQIANAK